MKYKVGDIVKLKSAEELVKDSLFRESMANEIGGNLLEIVAITHNLYRGCVQNDKEFSFIFSDDAISELINGNSSEEHKDDIYTFEELKKRVDDLKNYLEGYVNETRSLIMINIETEPNICPCGGDIANVNSLIKIIN